MIKFHKILFIALILVLPTACTSVKEIQKIIWLGFAGSDCNIAGQVRQVVRYRYIKLNGCIRLWSNSDACQSGEQEPAKLVGNIHNTKKRMPLILEPEDALKWIDKNITNEEIKNLMKPYNASKMKAHTVKKFIPAKPDNVENSEIIAYYYYPELVDLFDK